MRISLIVVSLSAILILIGCKATKLPVKKDIEYLDSEELCKRVYGNVFEYDGVIIRGAKVAITNNQGTNKLKLNLKIKNDSAIFVSIANLIGIEVTRAILTKDTIKLIDRVNNKYLVGSYKHISNMYNLPLNFRELEKVIINPNFLFNNYPKKDFIKSPEGNYYKTFTLSGNTEISFVVNASDYLIYKNSYKFIKSNKSVNIKYLEYINKDSKYFPKRIEVIYRDNYQKETNLIIDYNNIEFKKIDNFDLTVPKSYSTIHTD